MGSSLSLTAIFVMLVVMGYRRSMPAGASATWRDGIWVAAGSLFVIGVCSAAFALSKIGFSWPGNVLAAALLFTVFSCPLIGCYLIRLPRQAR